MGISCDGTFLASVSEDNTLILWNLQRVLHLDLLAYGCDRVRDFLRTNKAAQPRDASKEILSDRHLCDGISQVTMIKRLDN